MCKKIFVASTGQNTGKTTTSISLLHLARKKIPTHWLYQAVRAQTD